MNTPSTTVDRPKQSWWKPAAFLSVAALLVLLFADFGTDAEEPGPNQSNEASASTTTPSNELSSTTLTSTSLPSEEEPAPTSAQNPSKLDPGWYWSVSYEKGPSSLWISSPKTERRIGQTVDQSGKGVQLNDLAISPTGELFAISLTDLYQIDAADQNGDTIPMTKVGPLKGAESANALTFLEDGRLIAAGKKGVSQVSVETAIATSILEFGPGLRSSGDLIALPDQSLLITMDTGSERDALAQIRLDSGEFEIVVDDLPLATYGLTAADGRLFGLHVATDADPECGKRGVLIEIDIASQTTSTVRCLNFTPGGSAHTLGS